MRSFISSRARLLHQVRRRRSQAGAAFVESLIVISMILFVLFCVLWLHALYSAKLQTIQYARANAWGDALEGCPETSARSGLQETNTVLGDAVARSDDASSTSNGGPNTVSGLPADTQGDDEPPWFALRDGGEATESVDEFKGIMSGQNMDISTTRKFLCNERSNPDELKLSAGDLLSNIASVVRDIFN